MPRDWNAAYENEDTPWDKGRASPPLEDFLKEQAIAGRVLVPGCGTGHDVRLLAAQGASVLGLDIAPRALRKARSFPVVAGEGYEEGDFLDLPIPLRGCFDWVVEHTCLCALEPDQRAAYARAVGEALKPGGQFLAVFFREVPGYEGEGPPHPISSEEIAALFGGDFETLSRRVPERSYPSRPPGCEELWWMRRLT